MSSTVEVTQSSHFRAQGDPWRAELEGKVVAITGASSGMGETAAWELAFDIEIVSAPQEPDQRLVVYTGQPDSAPARVLPILASWHSEPVEADNARRE